MLNDAEKKINYRLSEIDEQIGKMKDDLAAGKAEIIGRLLPIEHKMRENKYEAIQYFQLSSFAIEMETASKKIGELIEEKRFLENLL